MREKRQSKRNKSILVTLLKIHIYFANFKKLAYFCTNKKPVTFFIQICPKKLIFFLYILV